MAVADIPSVIARADAIAQQKSSLANAATNNAIGLAQSITTPVVPPLSIDVNTPGSPGVPLGVDDIAWDNFELLRERLTEELTSQFSTFFATYFPLNNNLLAAMDWVTDALAGGGSGINAAVEASIWARERDRQLRESVRQEDELMSTWAARGYPLPPGALTFQLMELRKVVTDRISDSSREAAIKSWEAELENVRLAVDRALQARQNAMQAASDYIRALALGPTLGTQFSSSLADARVRLASAATALYSAQVNAAELPLRAAIAGSDASLRGAELTLKGESTSAELAVNAAVAAANSAGTQAAAALNAIHAQVGWNLNDNRDLTGTF